MCYNIAFLTKRQETYEKRYGARFSLPPPTPVYHSNGFAHPIVPVITCDSPRSIQLIPWKFIPHWAKDLTTATRLSRQALNARTETVFEKPMFRESIIQRRCVVLIDAFFEHQHISGQAIPYRIFHADDTPMSVAGIYSYSLYSSEGGFSILTVEANQTLAKIHISKRTNEARMPLLLPPETEQVWLESDSRESITSFFLPYSDDLLCAHTVGKLSGKEYQGNVPGIWNKVYYPKQLF